MSSHTLALVTCAILVLFSLSAKTGAQDLSNPLSGASTYNLFTFGDITLTNTDSEGRVAAGGNVNFNGYTVASALGASPSTVGNALVVRGNIAYNSGVVKYGNIRYGGSISGDVSAPNGTVSQGFTMDFDGIRDHLLLNSSKLAAAPQTGTIINNSGGITLFGTKSDINVFNLSGSVLNSAWGITIDAPTGSTVLVNVSGTVNDFDNLSYQFASTNGSGATDAVHTLYNFYDTTSLSIASVGIGGSILAPLADVDFNWAQLDGQLIANSVTGTGEVHNKLFSGSFGNITSVPEPTSPLLLTLAALFALTRRHNRR